MLVSYSRLEILVLFFATRVKAKTRVCSYVCTARSISLHLVTGQKFSDLAFKYYNTVGGRKSFQNGWPKKWKDLRPPAVLFWPLYQLECILSKNATIQNDNYFIQIHNDDKILTQLLDKCTFIVTFRK